MSTPLFVLGKQRSGTTWLANQLTKHPKIAAPSHPSHHGNHASLYFSHIMGRFGSLAQRGNYIALVELLMASDTIKMLGVTRAELYALWPTTYEGLFTTLMEQFAAREQATYWLEKTNENTVMVDKLAQMYPNAKFVATRRDLLANMRSTVGRYDLRGRKREVRIVRAAVDWVRHNKAVDDFARRHPERIYCLSYEDLKEDIEGTLAGICAFLELDYDPTMAVQAFKANTTFREGRKRDEVFRPRDKRLMDAAVKAANLVPLAVLNALAGDLTQAAHKKEIPDWFFSLYEPVALSSNEASQAASIRSVPDTVPRLPKTYAPQGEVFSSVS